MRFLLAAALSVASAGAPILDPPEVTLLDWNTRSLVHADLDGDGRTDLAVINNDRARIDLLLQREPGEVRTGADGVPEDGRFTKRSVVTGVVMYSLAAGDLNGDGRADLAFTAKGEPLTVLFQDGRGRFESKRTFEIPAASQWTSTLAMGELDGDGHLDVVLLTKESLLVFRGGKGGDLAGPQVYPLSDEGAYGLLVRDLDGDGRSDLAYLSPGAENSLRVRFRDEDGGFGPEHAFPLPVRSGTLAPMKVQGQGVWFVGVHARTGLVEFVSVEPADRGDEEAWVAPRQFAIVGAERGASAYALGDFDGDGRVDVAASDGRGAQVSLVLQRGVQRFGEARSYPSYPDVRSLASGDLDGDGRAELILASPTERAVGVARLSREGRLSYPVALPTVGKPLAVDAGDLDGDGRIDVVYAYDDDGERGVAIIPPEGEPRRFVLQGLHTDPAAIRILDANQDGRPDLGVFVLQNPLRLLLQAADGTFQPATAAAGFRQGLVDRLAPADLVLGDVDRDGRPEMLVAGAGFARALRIDAGGELQVVDQYNALDAGSDIAAALPADLDGDGVPEMVLVPKGGGSLQVLRRDPEGVYRHRMTLPVGPIDLVATAITDLEGDGRTDLMLFGRRRVWWIPVDRPDFRLALHGSYETGVEEMVLTDVAVGDLSGDGQVEVVLMDAQSTRQLEVLQPDGEGWKSVMNFSIFETDPHYAGRTGAKQEPREMLITDLTGDGRADLALLVHDRVLVYPAE